MFGIMSTPKYLPFLESDIDFPRFELSFLAFAATETFAKLLSATFTAPTPAPANASQTLKDARAAAILAFDDQNERFFGFLSLALAKVPFYFFLAFFKNVLRYDNNKKEIKND